MLCLISRCLALSAARPLIFTSENIRDCKGEMYTRNGTKKSWKFGENAGVGIEKFKNLTFWMKKHFFVQYQ